MHFKYHRIYFKSKNLCGFSFKLIPVKSNALFHPSLSCFYQLTKFFWDVLQLCLCGLLDVLHTFTIDPLEFGQKQKR